MERLAYHAMILRSASRMMAVIPTLDIEHVVGPVVKHASRHDAPEVAPVVGALLLRNHEIKGPSDRLACAVAEDVLGGLVPIANDPLAVRRNDRMRARRERGLRDGLFAC